MTQGTRRLLCALALSALPGLASAQVDSGGRRLHIGSSRPDTLTVRSIPDSILRAAVAVFNRPGGVRLYGDGVIPAAASLPGPLLAYEGRIRLDGRVEGDVLVINGDLLVSSTAAVTGAVTVLGGRLILQEGGTVAGPVIEYAEPAMVTRTANNTLVVRARPRSLAALASSNVSIQLGAVTAMLDGGVGQYNRVEGLPLRVSPSFVWRRDARTAYRLDLSGILRTTSDPSGSRSNLGWSARLASMSTGSTRPLTFGVAARELVAPMADQAFTPLESGLSTFLFHEDYRDWFVRKGWGLFADWRLTPHGTVHGSFDDDRERTAQAGDPFSVLRNNVGWRPNPLADDGRFRRLALGYELDSRDDSVHTSSGWWLRATLRRVSSSDLSPLSLPTSIRAPLPFTGYASSAFELDARRYLQLGPTASLHLRVLARGWLAGNPLLAQDRRAMGGADVLPGYQFRAVNCETRRTPDPSAPALCDRQVGLQAEYHRELDLNLSTRIGRYSLGLDHPSLILLADAGTAWLSGDGPGRVPSNRIQNLSEWRSDVGVGLDNHWVALYLAKSLADPGPVRLTIRLRQRF